jgi:hypothetical protein
MVGMTAENLEFSMAEHLAIYKVDMMVFLMVDWMGLKDWRMVLHLVLMAALSAALWELWV